MCEVLQNDGYGYLAGAHDGKDFVKIIGQAHIGKLVHEEMHMDGQASTVLMVGQIKELLKKLGVEDGDKEVEAGIVVRDQREQRHLFLSEAGQIQLIRSSQRGKALQIEFLQPSGKGDLDGFQRFGAAAVVVLVILHRDVIGVSHFQTLE